MYHGILIFKLPGINLYLHLLPLVITSLKIIILIFILFFLNNHFMSTAFVCDFLKSQSIPACLLENWRKHIVFVCAVLFIVCGICIRPLFLSYTPVVLVDVSRIWGRRHDRLFPQFRYFVGRRVAFRESDFLCSSSCIFFCPLLHTISLPLLKVQLLSLENDLGTNVIFTRH